MLLILVSEVFFVLIWFSVVFIVCRIFDSSILLFLVWFVVVVSSFSCWVKLCVVVMVKVGLLIIRKFCVCLIVLFRCGLCVFLIFSVMLCGSEILLLSRLFGLVEMCSYVGCVLGVVNSFCCSFVGKFLCICSVFCSMVCVLVWIECIVWL